MAALNRPRRESPGFLGNSVANGLAYVVSAATNFFLSPYIVHHLGDTAYGVLALMGSIVGYLGLLDFGVRGAITHFVAKQHAEHDDSAASATIASALRLFMGLGLLALLTACVMAVLVDNLFSIPQEMIKQAQTVIVLAGATLFVSFVGGVFGGVVASLQRFDLDSGLEIALTALRVVLVLLVFAAGYGLVALVAIQLGLAVLRGLVAFAFSRLLYPELRILARAQVGPAGRALVTFGLFSTIVHAARQVIWYTDAMVIGAFMPIAAITLYAIPSNLSDYARQIAGSISRIVTPRVSAVMAQDGHLGARAVLLDVGRWASFVTAPIAVTFALRGERFISLWMGPQYGHTSGLVLLILSPTVWFAGAQLVAIAAVMGVNRHRGLAPAYVGEAVVNLLLSLILVHSLGIVGVAIGTLIPFLLVHLGFVPWYLNRHMDIPLRMFAREVWARPAIATIPFAVGTAVVERVWVPSNLINFFLQTGLLLALMGWSVYRFGLDPEERARVGGFLRAPLPWRSRPETET